MARPSSIDRLPAEIRDAIGRLREEGHTIDEILEHLAKLQVDVSRSALGRHVKGLEKVGERLRRSRAIAEAFVRRLGEGGEDKAARLNIDLMQATILDLLMKAAEAEDSGEEDGEDGAKGGGVDAMGAMLVSKALDHLATAKRKDADFVIQVEKRAEAKALRDAAAAAEKVGREQGISATTIATIKAQIFGVRP